MSEMDTNFFTESIKGLGKSLTPYFVYIGVSIVTSPLPDIAHS